MKKFVLIIALIFGAFTVNAQTPGSWTSFANDTTTDAQTVYLALANPVNILGNYNVTLGVSPTNESGTATVTCIPQGKLGSGWYDLQSSADTINNAGTAASKSYVFTSANYSQYRLKIVSTGTGVTSFISGILIKKP